MRKPKEFSSRVQEVLELTFDLRPGPRIANLPVTCVMLESCKCVFLALDHFGSKVIGSAIALAICFALYLVLTL